MAITCASVNAALKKKGVAERLYRGKDYMYFSDGEAHTWEQTMVYVCSASDLTVAEWLEEYDRLKADAER